MVTVYGHLQSYSMLLEAIDRSLVWVLLLTPEPFKDKPPHVKILGIWENDVLNEVAPTPEVIRSVLSKENEGKTYRKEAEAE